VLVGAPAQNRLAPGMQVGTVEIVKPAVGYTLQNCMISSDSTGLSLNYTTIKEAAPTSPPDLRLIESDGTYPPAP
jgi:hypothetical protein